MKKESGRDNENRERRANAPLTTTLNHTLPQLSKSHTTTNNKTIREINLLLLTLI